MGINFTPYRTGNATIDRNLDQLKSVFSGVASNAVKRPAWTSASLQNGWAQESLTIPSLATCAYNLDGNNVVWGKGWVKNSTAGTLTNSIVYTLPVGMRPTETRSYAVRNASAGTVAFIDVLSTGDVQMVSAITSGSFVSVEFALQAEQ